MASILTDVGKSKLASATPENQLTITHIAVGDGDGGYPALLSSMTELTNEVWRGGASDPIRDDTFDNILIFEGFIPANVGGFSIREMAIFDIDGDMIAIGHTALIEKPSGGAGSGISLVVRMNIALESASQVDLIYEDGGFLDHAGLTNRDHAAAHPASSITAEALPDLGLPAGDAQTLFNALKNGALSPRQTSATDETTNALLTRGAWGLGKYLAIADANSAVRSGFYSLPASLGAGNSPVADTSGSLLVIEGGAAAGYITQVWVKSNQTTDKIAAFRNGYGDPITWDAEWTFLWHDDNLIKADTPTAEGAENDTDFMTALKVVQLIQANNDMTGAILFYGTTVTPAGYLKANGAAVSRTAYARLFNKVGTFWGAGDGSTTFNLPDVRGEFPRFFDDGRGIDSGRSFGTVQQATKLGLISGNYGNNIQGMTDSDGPDGTVDLDTGTFGGTIETFTYYQMRPRNIALIGYIKY